MIDLDPQLALWATNMAPAKNAGSCKATSGFVISPTMIASEYTILTSALEIQLSVG
jgi:hypothetical protein